MMFDSQRAIGIGLAAVVLDLCFVFALRKHRRNELPTTKDQPLLYADDGTEVPPEVAKAMRAVVAEKSVALDHASVVVHRTYNYDGPTSIKHDELAKTIAVDVTFSDYTDRFKISDVDIINGIDDENFGSDADYAFLDATGNFHSYDGNGVDITKPLRLLMIFAVRKETETVKLGYWGRNLTPAAIQLESGGQRLPRRD